MVSLIHTGDWHIGKGFGGFGDKAPVLQKARVDAIDRIAGAARSAGARHVLVAGDTFHSPALDLTVLRPVMARLAGHADLTWHLIPGNHDPGSAQIWTRLAGDGLPAGVRLHLDCASVEIESGVVLLPCPLGSKFSSGDPTSWLDGVVTAPGQVRIGLAHGATVAFGGGSGEPRGVIAADRAERAGLDYLALGDWHGVRAVTPRAWYAGTPEPDQYPDNEPGHVLGVRIDGAGAPPVVTRYRVATFTWRRMDLVLAGAADLDRFEGDVLSAGAEAAHWLVSLRLSGRLAMADDARLGERLMRLAAHLFVLDVDREALVPSGGLDEVDVLASGDLGWAAEQILAAGGEPGSDRAAVSARALRKLMAVAADVAREGRA